MGEWGMILRLGTPVCAAFQVFRGTAPAVPSTLSSPWLPKSTTAPRLSVLQQRSGGTPTLHVKLINATDLLMPNGMPLREPYLRMSVPGCTVTSSTKQRCADPVFDEDFQLQVSGGEVFVMQCTMYQMLQNSTGQQ